MNLRALPDGLRRFVLDAIPPEPWRNAGGWTRTLASAHDDAGVLWRISVADIESEGPFSTFAGMDRTAVLLEGAGLMLAGAGEPIRFQSPGDAAAFPGEAQMRSRLGRGPARLLNVMTRRAASVASVETCPLRCDAPPHGGVMLLLAVAGRVEVNCAGGTLELSLDSGEGLELRGGPPAENRTGASFDGDGLWLTVSIRS